MFDRFFESQEKFSTQSKFSTPPRTKESKLLLCKCSRTRKDYFTRIDRKRGENSWKFAYAFPFHVSLKGDSCIAAKREVINIVDSTEDWNGCPYCGKKDTVFCECGAIFCIETGGIDGIIATCPVCNRSYPTYRTTTVNTNTSSY